MTADDLDRGATFIGLRSDDQKRPSRTGDHGKGVNVALSAQDRAELLEGHTGNRGLLTGHRRVEMPDGTFRGVCVLDVDHKPERAGFPAKEGPSQLVDLLESLGPLPDTLTLRTASGAWHLYFEMPEAIDHVSNKVFGNAAPDIEFQNEGHQVVYAGGEITDNAVSRSKGYICGRYEWVDRSVPIARLPEAWIARLLVENNAPVKPMAPVGEAPEFVDRLPPEHAAFAASVAAAAAKDAPLPGNRRLGMLAVAGALCGTGGATPLLPLAFIPAFVTTVNELAGFHDPLKKRRAAEDTISKVRMGIPVTGFNKLREYGWNATADALDAPARAAAAEWKPGSSVKGANDVAVQPESAPFFRWGEWDRPVPPVQYMVQGIVPERTVGMFVAHGNSLKTWTALSLAAAVSSGQSWLGAYRVKKARAAILDYENGEHEIRRRMHLLARGQALGDFGYRRDDRNLRDPALWRDVAASGVQLLIIDGLSAGSGGVDENTTLAAEPLHLARAFTEGSGGSVIFIHHSNKGEKKDEREQVRGSSAIFAALDHCYRFATADGVAQISCLKMRMGNEPQAFSVHLSDAAGLELVKEVAYENRPGGLSEAILLALSAGPLSAERLRAKLHKRAKVVTDELRALKSEGRVFEDDGWHLDDDAKRVERVMTLLAERPIRADAQKLAALCHVSPDFVRRLERERLISQSAGTWRDVSPTGD